MVAEDSDQLAACLCALHLLELPYALTQLELHLEKLAFNLAISKVFLCLSEELDEDDAGEFVVLGAHPVHVA